MHFPRVFIHDVVQFIKIINDVNKITLVRIFDVVQDLEHISPNTVDRELCKSSLSIYLFSIK